MVSWGVNFPHKNGPIPLWLAPHLITSKSPSANLYALPSPINMTTMIRQNTKCYIQNTKYKVLVLNTLLLDPPGKPNHQHIHCPTANFELLSRGSITNPILITVGDTYLTSKLIRTLGLSQDLSGSECSALTHFSMSLAWKYVNLKEPYNEDIKE